MHKDPLNEYFWGSGQVLALARGSLEHTLLAGLHLFLGIWFSRTPRKLILCHFRKLSCIPATLMSHLVKGPPSLRLPTLTRWKVWKVMDWARPLGSPSSVGRDQTPATGAGSDRRGQALGHVLRKVGGRDCGPRMLSFLPPWRVAKAGVGVHKTPGIHWS